MRLVRGIRRGVAAALLVLVLLIAGCAGDDSSGDAEAGPTTTAAPTTTTTSPPTAVTLVSEQEVEPGFRQGVARVDDGWIFSTNDAFFRTDEQLVETARLLPAIPPDWGAQGYNHIGDIDVEDGVLYAPLEKEDKEIGEQAMARYDPDTLAFIDAVPVAQHHASFVTVDPQTMIAYSQDFFGGDTLLRYDLSDGGWAPLEPLTMSAFVDRTQGADVRDGAVWLSTDDAHDGVYRVDLETGDVTDLGTIGRADGEAEGIDATAIDPPLTTAGDLHVLTIDVTLAPVRFVHLAFQ
jgi:hypothetical protein